ncbi:hypothetical protein M1C57_08585 [Rhodococcus pyridinivorans]|uniref:Uncharacterized protein n=1 Tax=Rhodococcus pyridinivorans TaxID=103816 RepID=A0A7M2XL45_9NOCA|nr:hypothetical protein [Rhodococcus pyridinivorans]QOV98143.1 hypothetical protein INP59_20035 [Rhodococcus pyridinivorans]UPW06055.1 hypothetical protein M1C57_08585 [Rhodococcus pyridinivorans]WMM72025.1 hypothetical protein RCF27_19485 [Rhodococcus pyridinivorans]
MSTLEERRHGVDADADVPALRDVDEGAATARGIIAPPTGSARSRTEYQGWV